MSDQDQDRVWKGLDRLEEIEEQRSSRREKITPFLEQLEWREEIPELMAPLMN